MDTKELEKLKKKYFKELSPLDDSAALAFLSAFDNLLYLKERESKRLAELKELVNDSSVNDGKKSNYRYEGSQLYQCLTLINEALQIGNKLLSYKETPYKEFMEKYHEIVIRLDY